MKLKLLFWSLLGLIWSQSGYALTVTELEVINKTDAVTIQKVEFQQKEVKVLADAKGISIYTFDQDAPGKSVCTGGCLAVWPPVTVTANTRVEAPFGTIKGNHGKLQLTLKGLPLYYFVQDKRPGDVFGHYPDWQLVFVK